MKVIVARTFAASIAAKGIVIVSTLERIFCTEEVTVDKKEDVL
jgi:hypothetical protein